MRLGYVSADLCQHTVGLFVKDVLKAHDRSRVQVFAYSAGQHKDRVTDEIRAACTLRDVSALEDETLAEQIRTDGIDILIDLLRRIEAEEMQWAMNAKTILYVGPGHRSNGAKLPVAFQGTDWKELRLDIDPTNEPDIVGSMLDMAAVANESVDAIYSAHNIEHVYAHEVPQVLSEFLRVLKPDGFLIVTCPDLQSVCQLVAEDKLGDAAYQSPAGPITPLDILYGQGAALAAGHQYLAHKTGFTLKTLTQALHTAGFAMSAGKRRLKGLDLWVVASKGPMAEAALRELAGKVLPGRMTLIED